MPDPKLHRCVQKIKAKGRVRNPQAVCRAALKKKAGSKQKGK